MTACKLSLEPILSYWTYFASVCTGAILLLKKRQRNIWSFFFVFFGRKKHKNTKTHWLSGAILLLGRRKKMGQCVFVFSGKKHKNTKTHRLSGAILMLKKDKETFGQCVFVFFGRKKHKNTKTHWVSDARSVGGNHKIA